MVQVPADAITAHIRRMEGAAAMAVGCIIASLVLSAPALLFVAAVRSWGPFLGGGESVYATGLALLPPLGWLVSCNRFRRLTERRVGWLAGFLKYHFLALLLVVLLAGIFALLAWAMYRLCMPKGYTDGGALRYLVLMVVASVLIVFLIKPLVSPLHRRLVDSIAPLRREIAIALTREYLRKQMHRGPGPWRANR